MQRNARSSRNEGKKVRNERNESKKSMEQSG